MSSNHVLNSCSLLVRLALVLATPWLSGCLLVAPDSIQRAVLPRSAAFDQLASNPNYTIAASFGRQMDPRRAYPDGDFGRALRGIVYQEVTEPLMINFDRTQVSERERQKSSLKHLRYYVEFLWDNDSIMELAKKHGFKEVYYVDFQTISVWTLWREYYVHIYGA